jgi:hypothetical protein
MSIDLVDMLGKGFQIGDKVAKAQTSGRAVNLEIGEVTRIDNGRLYLSGSKVPVNFPGRLLVVTKLFDEMPV